MSISRYYHTIRHLRLRQVWYCILRPVQRRFYTAIVPPAKALAFAKAHEQCALYSFAPFDAWDEERRIFTFLNLSCAYPGNVNWNDARQGALWAFHLNYFNWLEDEAIPVAARLNTIKEYTAVEGSIEVGLSSYTISLRSISWIRFFLKHGLWHDDSVVLLYQHLHRLHHFPEYEIDGNHLWENGCALIMGGLYFDEQAFFSKGIKILNSCFGQIGEDGGHKEGSPVYHNLLLLRILMCTELSRLSRNSFRHDFTGAIANKMLAWSETFTFSSGTPPWVNDSAEGVAPPFPALKSYAATLGIYNDVPTAGLSLGYGGYRMFRNDFFELFTDVANIEPAWQPGHHHADTLSFCLNAGNRSVIVDTGVSTYDEGEQRNAERSTAAHNTITINDGNSSDIWKSFRVGMRATVTIVEETTVLIRASHDGYKNIGVIHERLFTMGVDKIIIEDKLKGLKKQKALLHLHFQAGIELKSIGENCFSAWDLTIKITGHKGFGIGTYMLSEGFNKRTEAQRLIIEAGDYTRISIERIHPTNAD